MGKTIRRSESLFTFIRICISTAVISKIGSSTIINRSDKDLFVPNKTSAEYDAWSKKAPNYVAVEVCL